MSTQRLTTFFSVLMCLAFVQACSSSSSGTVDADTVSATSPESLNATLSAIEGLLQTIEADEGSSSSLLDRSIGSQASNFSVTGCMVKETKDQILAEGKQLGAPLCYISKLEEALDEFTLSTDRDTYLKITQTEEKDGQPEERSFTLKMKLTGDSSNPSGLQYAFCNPDGSGGSAQGEAFIAEKLADANGVKIRMQHTFADSGGDGSFNGQADFTIEAKGEKNSELSEVRFYGNHQDTYTFTGQDGTETGSGRAFMDLFLDGTNKFYRLRQGFQHQGTRGGETHDERRKICAFKKGKDGVAEVAGQSIFPAWSDPNSPSTKYCPNGDPTQPPTTATGDTCTVNFSFNEAFTEDTSVAGRCVIDDAPPAFLSEKLADCANDLPDVPEESTLAFAVVWDCSIPEGADVVEINMNSFPEVIAACENERSNDSGQSCFEEKIQEDGQVN